MKVLLLNIWAEWPGNRPYLNHDEHEIWHVCNPNGTRYLRNFLADDEIEGLSLPNSDDPRELLETLKTVYRSFPFERVVAVDELTVLPAAYIREVFNIPGPRVAQIEPFRNKRKMKALLAQQGIRVIRDLDPTTLASDTFTTCVIKKTDGTAASGVRICRSREEFVKHAGELEKGALLEEYVAGEFFHIDGAFNATGFVAIPHAYINTCYDHYAHAQPLGSVGVDDPILKQRLIEFARQVTDALPLREGVFHLEVIRSDQDELIFLEIASRVGGGEICKNFIDVYNFDLLGFHIQSQLGLTPLLRKLRDHAVAGWLMLNSFQHVPGIFAGVRCRALTDENCMYSMWSPQLGRKFEDREHQYVKFSLRGKTSAEVRASIHDLIANVAVDSLPLPAPTPQDCAA